MHPTAYEDTDHFQMTRAFLDAPEPSIQLAAARAVRGRLYGVPPWDPVTFAVVLVAV